MATVYRFSEDGINRNLSRVRRNSLVLVGLALLLGFGVVAASPLDNLNPKPLFLMSGV